MSKPAYIVWMVVMTLVTVLLQPYTFEIFSAIFLKKGAAIVSQLALFKWAACGCVLYSFLHKRLPLNLRWLETDSHEKLHGIVGWLFGRRIHASHAEEGSGVIYTSGTSWLNRIGLIPMSLAPYCLPFWTIVLLLLRSLVAAKGLWIFDIVVGASIAFYVICYKEQTGKHQTDISQYPLSFSYFYIYLMRLIFALIIIVSFFPQTQTNGVFYPLTRMCKSMWTTLLSIVHYIF